MAKYLSNKIKVIANSILVLYKEQQVKSSETRIRVKEIRYQGPVNPTVRSFYFITQAFNLSYYIVI